MMVIKYSYKKDKNKKLSEHFKVGEFQCHNGNDEILINTDLIKVLEKIYKHMNAKAINIYSGYRDMAYDLKVGGKSSHQHAKGNAADIQVKYQDGTFATGKEISYAVEELNLQCGCGTMKGTTCHIDVRGKKCWFDETASNPNKLYDSYYEHFGAKRMKVNTVTKKPTAYFNDLTDTKKSGSLKYGTKVRVINANAGTVKYNKVKYNVMQVMTNGTKVYVIQKKFKNC